MTDIEIIELVKKNAEIYYVEDGDLYKLKIQYCYVSNKGINRIYAKNNRVSKNFKPFRFGIDVFLSYDEALKAIERKD